jgi:hypothetical protein
MGVGTRLSHRKLHRTGSAIVILCTSGSGYRSESSIGCDNAAITAICTAEAF